MPSFENLNDLSKHINANNGASAMDSRDIQQVLIKEARRLEQLLQAEIDKYYRSYQPKEYIRTGKWLESITVNPPTSVDGINWSIAITFDKDLSYHDSVIDSSQPKGYVPWLMEVGWDTRNKMPYEAYRFTHFEGTGYIKKAVQKFNSTNPHGIIITVYYNGNKYI